MAANRADETCLKGRAGVGFRLQSPDAFGKQIIRGMPGLRVVALRSEFHRAAGYFGLAQPAVPGDLFDDVPALVARGEIAVRIDAPRIGAQLGFDQADLLENFRVV